MIARGAVLSSIHNEQPYHRNRPLTICDIEIEPPQPG
ncbi:MAG: hypothetical protein K0R68_4051, partial [Mycobacterium sp.]|nr:hypothetical protein [Mycobacterium sp.]